MTLEPQDFANLRRSAIAHAQAASGNIWTDFNLHDPGVTLLEQTCYALSEVSFQATHTTRDLLTDDTGHIRFGALSLFLPQETLPGDPVTLLDLAADLSEVVGIARVLISAGPRAGLLNAIIIPANGDPNIDPNVEEGAAKEAIRQAFYARRPLGCDLNRLKVARRTPARLFGEVHISGTAIPERVAAEIYYQIGVILRGQNIARQAAAGATRQTVFDQPQTYWHAPANQDGNIPNLEDHLARFRQIPGVTDISNLVLTRQDVATPAKDHPADTFYLDLSLPDTAADIDLELTLNGLPLKLDPSQMLEEFVRVSADHIAQAQHHLDAKDWVPPQAGQRRNFDPAHVDALLPNVYGAGAKSSPEAQLLTRYRSAVNAQLGDMAATLRDLPAFLTAPTDAMSDDPHVLRQRVELLDFLIAHQGEEMPETMHAGLHVYRCASERAHFEMRWRLDFLEALPVLNRARGTGPDGDLPGAFLRKFRLLADLDTARDPAMAQLFQSVAVSTDRLDNDDVPEFARADLNLPDNPFDMLIPHDPLAEPLPESDFEKACPWITQGHCSAEIFKSAADPKLFLVSQTAEDRFSAFFDPGHPTHLHLCGSFKTLAEATTFTQRLRASWKAFHAGSERAYLIEDILLRNASTDFAPNVASMVLTGWTARTCQPTYRAYVERLIETLSPAHMLIRPLWLDHEEMARFEDFYPRYLAGDPDAKRDLRALLVERTAPA